MLWIKTTFVDVVEEIVVEMCFKKNWTVTRITWQQMLDYLELNWIDVVGDSVKLVNVHFKEVLNRDQIFLLWQHNRRHDL